MTFFNPQIRPSVRFQPYSSRFPERCYEVRVANCPGNFSPLSRVRSSIVQQFSEIIPTTTIKQFTDYLILEIYESSPALLLDRDRENIIFEAIQKAVSEQEFSEIPKKKTVTVDAVLRETQAAEVQRQEARESSSEDSESEEGWEIDNGLDSQLAMRRQEFPEELGALISSCNSELFRQLQSDVYPENICFAIQFAFLDSSISEERIRGIFQNPSPELLPTKNYYLGLIAKSLQRLPK